MCKICLNNQNTRSKKLSVMTWEDYNFWLERKEAYRRNLKNGVGHKPSIEALLEKIDKKLSTAIVTR